MVPTPVVPADSPVTPAGFVDTESATNAAPIITQSDIDAKIKEVTEIAGLDEATKKEALERLKAATEWLKTAKEAAEKPSKFQAEIDAAPNELRDAKQTLAVPKTEPQFQIYESTPLPQIEQATTDAERD